MNRYSGLVLLLCYGWSLSNATNTVMFAVGGNDHGEPCVFPFKYKSKWYLDCIGDDPKDGRLWCATTVDYDTDKKWGYCTHNLVAATGGSCVIPFTYKYKLYSDCTDDRTSVGYIWCPVIGDGRYGYCKCKVTYAVGGNSNGHACVFPFKFKSKWYSDCTADGTSDGRLWCSTTTDFDKDHKWGYCSRIQAVGGNVDGQPCVFPFKHNSKWYMDCTTDGKPDGRFWCSTTVDYDKDQKWGYCSNNLVHAVGGKANGEPCVFPFKYKSKWYWKCTGDGATEGRLWCATTEDFDKDEKWGYCAPNLIYAVGGKANGEPCVFPFKHKSKWYWDCSRDNTTEGRAWCATTEDFDKDLKWGYCTHKLMYAVGGTAKGEPCVFPFKYKAKWYSDCISDDISEGHLWCATTADYDTDQKWGYCTRKLIHAVGGNSDGEPCIFPFRYKSKWYSDCTSDGNSDGLLWCATTMNYVKDRKWGYCSANDNPDCEQGTTSEAYEASLPNTDVYNSGQKPRV